MKQLLCIFLVVGSAMGETPLTAEKILQKQLDAANAKVAWLTQKTAALEDQIRKQAAYFQGIMQVQTSAAGVAYFQSLQTMQDIEKQKPLDTPVVADKK